MIVKKQISPLVISAFGVILTAILSGIGWLIVLAIGTYNQSQINAHDIMMLSKKTDAITLVLKGNIYDIKTQCGRYDELFEQDEKKIAGIEGKLGINFNN